MIGIGRLASHRRGIGVGVAVLIGTGVILWDPVARTARAPMRNPSAALSQLRLFQIGGGQLAIPRPDSVQDWKRVYFAPPGEEAGKGMDGAVFYVLRCDEQTAGQGWDCRDDSRIAPDRSFRLRRQGERYELLCDDAPAGEALTEASRTKAAQLFESAWFAEAPGAYFLGRRPDGRKVYVDVQISTDGRSAFRVFVEEGGKMKLQGRMKPNPGGTEFSCPDCPHLVLTNMVRKGGVGPFHCDAATIADRGNQAVSLKVEELSSNIRTIFDVLGVYPPLSPCPGSSAPAQALLHGPDGPIEVEGGPWRQLWMAGLVFGGLLAAAGVIWQLARRRAPSL